MLAISGVDVAYLGYMDLSVDFGLPGQVDHPDMIGAIEKLIEVSNRRSVASGIISPRMDIVKHWVRRGMRFVSYSTEALLLRQAAAAAVMEVR